jgi:DNA-binding MarR family transcriptional regulator
MIDKMSNASRLVEKLRQKGYVKRTECSEDRRRVDIVITDLGLEMVDQASQALEAMMNELFEGIPEAEAVQVNQVLDQMRE